MAEKVPLGVFDKKLMEIWVEEKRAGLRAGEVLEQQGEVEWYSA